MSNQSGWPQPDQQPEPPRHPQPGSDANQGQRNNPWANQNDLDDQNAPTVARRVLSDEMMKDAQQGGTGHQQAPGQHPAAPAYGQATYGQGLPASGQASYGQPQGTPGYGSASYGQPQATPGYGQPGQAPQPAYGSDQGAYATPATTGAKRSMLPMVIAGLIALGAILALIGTFGHWWSFEFKLGSRSMTAWMDSFGSWHSPDGRTADDSEAGSTVAGIFVIIGAVVALAGAVMMFLRKFPRPGALAAAAMGLMITIFGIVDMVRVNNRVEDLLKDKPADSAASLDGGAGWGLWLALIAGVIMLGAGVFGALRGHK